MDKRLEEFQRLLNELSVKGKDASLELLLRQMDADRARCLRLCAIPHEFDVLILRALAPGLTEEQASAYCDVVVLIGVQQAVDQVRGQGGHRGEEAQVARAARQTVETGQEVGPIGRSDQFQANPGTVLQRDDRGERRVWSFGASCSHACDLHCVAAMVADFGVDRAALVDGFATSARSKRDLNKIKEIK